MLELASRLKAVTSLIALGVLKFGGDMDEGASGDESGTATQHERVRLPRGSKAGVAALTSAL